MRSQLEGEILLFGREAESLAYLGAVANSIGMDDPLAIAIGTAIRGGDLDQLEALLQEHPDLVNVQILGRRPGGYRSPLHVVADWPGYFPNGPAVARLLLARGADPNGGEVYGHGETPLHWAASSDDVDVAEVLIDGGADIHAPAGSIAGGSPLDNAVGYACWRVARLLVHKGARVERLWHAAALGMLERTEELLPNATPDQINQAFWHACSAGERRAAELLAARGADLNFVPDYAKGTPLDVAGSLGTGRQALVTWLRECGARSATN